MITRRGFAGALGAAGLAGGCRAMLGGMPRHRSDYAGIRIGAITYSFAQMPRLPRGCTKGFVLDAGIGSVELMDRDFERDIGVIHRDIPAKFLSKEQKIAISQWRDICAFVRKYRDRLASIHIKDRKRANGPECAFGSGDTPLAELFACLKRERIDVPCDIEVEFSIPAESDAVKETAKCREYCRRAILG